MHAPGNPFVLPTHPTMRHPYTGELLRAVGMVGGRPVWPIMGASPDDDPPQDPPKNDPPQDPPKDPPSDPPKNDPPADPPGDKGFPENTPRSQMTDAERLAYDAHHGRKWEQRAKDWQSAFPDKTPAEIKAELDESRRAKMSADERAIDDAKQQGRVEAAKDFGTEAARVALEFALGHDPEKNDQSILIDSLDLSKVLTDEGKVDAAKVRDLASKIAPSDKGQGNQRQDYGAGRRGAHSGSSVSSGRDRYRERHGKSDKDD